VREGIQICHYFRDNDTFGFPWDKGGCFGDGNITSAPALIQSSNSGSRGNFEVVAQEGKTLCHYYRDNDAPELSWEKSECFGSGNGTSAPALIQSNFGNKGNFQVLVQQDTRLCHYYRDNDSMGIPGASLPWTLSECLPTGNVQSAAAFIQSNFGDQRNFEVVVQEATPSGSQLCHYYRDNDKPGFPWSKSGCFGDNRLTGKTPTLIQSNFGNKGNLEVVVQEVGDLCHYYRDNDTPGFPWSNAACTPF
jgi:hypothetical protein